MNFNKIEQVTVQATHQQFIWLYIGIYSKGAVDDIAWARYPDGYLSSKVCCLDLLVTWMCYNR